MKLGEDLLQDFFLCTRRRTRPLFGLLFNDQAQTNAQEGGGGSVELDYRESLDALLQCSYVELDF